VLPEPNDLGVSTLVRGQGRVPERDSQEDGEEHSRKAGDRWGPPRADLDRRAISLAIGALVLVIAATSALFGFTLSPDRYAVLLIVPALVIRRGRRYLLDFLPFVALIVAYAEARGLAHVLRPNPYVRPQLHLEQWLFGGSVPSAVLQRWLWSGHERWYDSVILVVTRIHSFVPLTLAFVLWMRRRALFYRFATTMLVLSFAAAFTFAIFPAAPPWEAGDDGLISVVKIGGHATSRVTTLWAPYDATQGNPDAAIPSLHGGYAFLVFLFIAMLGWRTRWRWWVVGVAALYPAAQCFAAVYTGNHYVVDLLLGFAYAAAAFFGVGWAWRRLGLPPADGWTVSAAPVSTAPASGAASVAPAYARRR
jgi:membrane-associated phospholipid phosphatase